MGRYENILGSRITGPNTLKFKAPQKVVTFTARPLLPPGYAVADNQPREEGEEKILRMLDVEARMFNKLFC
jgi:hypothetical protein